MSQKTDLQSNNIDLQSILNTINNLPDAGSGGSSGGVDTCTVTITSFKTLISYAYTAYENNNLVAKGSVNPGTSTPLILDNVVCGSAIFISNSYYMNGTTVGGGVEVSVPMVTIGGIFRAPATAGALGTIDVYDDD